METRLLVGVYVATFDSGAVYATGLKGRRYDLVITGAMDATGAAMGGKYAFVYAGVGIAGDRYDFVITGADTICLTSEAGVTDVYADSSSVEYLIALPCVYVVIPPSVS